MSTSQKIYISVALLVSVFGMGYYTGRSLIKPDIQIQYQDRVTEKQVKGETQIVYKDRTVTVTKTVYPNGTTTTTTKTEDKNETADKKTSETDKDTTKTVSKTETAVASQSKNYSLGVSYFNQIHSYGDLLNLTSVGVNNLEVTAGYRLLGDVWLESGVVPTQGAFSIGLSVKF